MQSLARQTLDAMAPGTKTRAVACVKRAFSIAVCLLLVQAAAQTIRGQVTLAHPSARVRERVDSTRRMTLGGHVVPAIRRAMDLGRLPGNMAMNHMVMVLQSSPEQNHALQSLLDQQLDSGHPNFHKWMTPAEFGAHFGVADADISKVTDWLSQQGFSVESVSPGKRFIQFSGNVGQVEFAFHTEMHRYNVNGTLHVANSSDISVPAALKPVISSVPTLHDFFKKSDATDDRTITADADTGKVYESDPYRGSAPNYTSGTTHFVGPGDFAAIYNTTPLLSTGNDGTGVSIGVIGRTDINLGDVQIYRTMFGLKPNDPAFVIAGEDPGVVATDESESYLDVEVSGGAAPGAAIQFIVAQPTLVSDGVDLAAMYDVQNNLTDIISESYGQCENNVTAAAASFYSNLWAQAAAQGQSVFLSSGDNGPAGCDNTNSTFESFGYAVSVLGSSPYNVAVGGTLFADTAANWNSTTSSAPPFSSALGYIPEVAWNEAKGSGAVGAAGLWSGSGGISAYFVTPSWQHGFGVPASDPAYAGTGAFSSPASPFVPGPHRYLPDVAMAAAAQHAGTLYCREGICQLSSTGGLLNAGIIGGTSVAAPTMAGVQALINQYNGGRQGQPNYVYYTLADNQHTAGLNCAANSATIDSGCAFHDVTTGNTLVCANSACTAANKIGWTAGAGYDLATGLGSPNATNLAQLWSTVTFRSSTTSMGLSQTTGIAHGQAIVASGTVAPGSGTGVPTGTVAFILSSGGLNDPVNSNTGAFQNPVSVATLDGSGNYSVNVSNLPAGTYYVTARYGGDATFASSISAPIQVTVASEGSGVVIQPNAFNGTTCVETPQTTFTYGSYIWTDIIVTGASGQGVPTGTLAVTDNGNPLLTTSLNAAGEGHMLSGAIPTTSCVSGYTIQDTAPLTAGTHVLGATYSGDSTFNSMTATPVTVTITPASVTGALTTSATTIASGSPVQLTVTTVAISGVGPGTLSPTGTVTFTDNTTATVLGTATLSATTVGAARAILTTTSITTAGANSITASWQADTNYNAGNVTAAVTVTVANGTATSVAVTSNTNPSILGGRPTFTATMTPTTVTSGTVNFFDGGVLLGAGTVGAAHTATFRPAATVNLPAGVHIITAVYAGNPTFSSSVSPNFSQTFNRATTTVNLTVKSSGVYGERFTFNGVLGTIIAATPPTGTIQFLDGGTPVGSPVSMTTVATASGGFGLYEGTLLQNLDAGTHTITAQLTDSNYTAAISNSQTITVSQATATIALSNTVQTYTGSPLAVTATTTPAGLSTVDISYTGSGSTLYGPSTTAPTNVGTYAVTATLTNANYTGTQSGTLTINQATAAIALTNTVQTYTGSPLAVTATTTPAGLTTVGISYTGSGSTTYGPSTSAPTNVGTYAVTATLANANYTGTQSGTLIINQATATIALTNTVQTYTGSPLDVTATTTPVGLTTVGISYTGTGSTTYGPSTTAPTNAGTYAVTATLTNANYTGTQSGTLTINQAAAAIALTNTVQIYTGSPLPVTATTTPAGLSTVSISYTGTGGTTYGPSTTAPTNVGTYAVTATLTNANYTGTQDGTLTINQATAAIALTNTAQTYTGSPLAVTATTTPVGLTTVGISYTGTGSTTYGPSATAPINVGTYSVTATLTNANYTGTQSGTLTINQATATIALTNAVQTYTGSPLAVTATTTPVGLTTVGISYTGTGATTYGPSTTAPTNVGTYSVTATLTNANYTGTQSGTLTINQATATIALTNAVQTYTGSPLAVTVTTTPVGLTTVGISYTGTGTTTYGPSTTAPTNVGTYAVTATLTNANYTGTQSGTLTINQATATIALTNTVQIYTGSPLAVTATTTPVGLTTVGISYTGTGTTTYGPSTTAPTNVGTYAVTATLT
ncbi:MAG TPA: MBG domain-containing protein, partial [Acidobacteriaceae bacterium]